MGESYLQSDCNTTTTLTIISRDDGPVSAAVHIEPLDCGWRVGPNGVIAADVPTAALIAASIGMNELKRHHSAKAEIEAWIAAGADGMTDEREFWRKEDGADAETACADCGAVDVELVDGFCAGADERDCDERASVNAVKDLSEFEAADDIRRLINSRARAKLAPAKEYARGLDDVKSAEFDSGFQGAFLALADVIERDEERGAWFMRELKALPLGDGSRWDEMLAGAIGDLEYVLAERRNLDGGAPASAE